MLRLPLLAAAILLVVGCGGASGPDNTTPEGAVQVTVTALRQNDLATMLENAMPAAKRAELAAAWDEMRAEPMSDEEKVQFNQVLAQVTAEGAEETLFMMAKPQLAQAQEQLAQAQAMLPMVMGMAMAQQEGLNDEQKQQAQAAISAISGWVGGLDITDEAKLKQAIGTVCETARGLGISNADELRGLGFDTLIAKAGPAMGGLKKVLAVYGLDLDATFDSVQFGAPLIEGDTATITTTSTLLGQPLTQTSVLKLQEGRWYVAAQ